MSRASIAIFPKNIKYSDSRSQPEVPDEIFEAAQRIAKNKQGCELIRNKTGLYVVSYSENGPSNRPEGWSEWMPIYVSKIETWASGGIQTKELNEHLKSKEDEKNSN